MIKLIFNDNEFYFKTFTDIENLSESLGKIQKDFNSEDWSWVTTLIEDFFRYNLASIIIENCKSGYSKINGFVLFYYFMDAWNSKKFKNNEKFEHRININRFFNFIETLTFDKFYKDLDIALIDINRLEGNVISLKKQFLNSNQVNNNYDGGSLDYGEDEVILDYTEDTKLD